jgi:hypothetical protein
MSNKLQTYEPKGAQPVVTRLASIDTIKHNLKIHLDGFEDAKKRMPMHAIAAGLWLLNLKDVLPHGEFMDWCEKNIDVKDRQANKFMQLAGFFLEYSKLQKAETLLLSDGKLSADEKKQRTSIEKMLVEFVGDNSQADLFEKYGRRGGKREITGHRRTMEDIDREHAQVIWHDERLAELEKEGLAKKSWNLLEPERIRRIATVFARIALEMKDELKARKET